MIFIGGFARALAPALIWGGILAGSVSAQGADGDLRGRVVDESGAPLQSVEIGVPEIGRRVFTDRDGRFAVTGLRPGRYTIVASRLGYARRIVSVELPLAQGVDIVLGESPIELPGLNVSTTRRPGPTETSLPVSTLDGDELRRARAAGLAQTLEAVPGLRSASTGAQNAKPVIRGLSGTRVLVLDNGARLENQNWGDEHGPNVDPWMAHRIEVVRGPASVLYGSDALAGVINVVPADLPDAVGVPSFARAAGALTLGSNNDEVGAAARLEGAHGPFGFSGTLTGRQAQDLRTPAGRLANSGFDQWAASLGLGLRRQWGDAALRYRGFHADYEVVEPEDDAAPWLAFRDHRVQGAVRRWLGGHQLEARAQWERNRLREFEEPGEAEVDLVLRTTSVDLLLHHEDLGRLRGTVGVSGVHQVNDTRGEEPLVPDATWSDLGVFVFEEVRLSPRWSAALGARLDRRWLEAEAEPELAVEAQTRDYTAATGNAGLLFRPLEGVALAANLGRAWRAPNFFELFAQGVHEGTARFEIGDPELDPESSVNLDLSVRWNQPQWGGEVTAFRNRIDGFLFIEPTAEVDSASGLRKFRYRGSDATLWGAEGRVRLDPLHQLGLEGRFDWVRGEERGGEPLPLMPPVRVVLGAEVHEEVAWSWLESARLGYESEIVTRQTRLSSFDQPTGAYVLHHVGAGAALRWGGRRVGVDLSVRNLGDRAYRNFLSRYKEFALDPGRNVQLRISTGL